MPADDPARGVPWGDWTLRVILASTLLGVMGVSLVSPALPAMRAALGITETQASWILSAFTLPGIVLGPIVGVLADRYGRRPVLVPCLVAYAVTGAGVLVAPNLATILLLRVVQGVAAAGLLTLALTLIGDLFTGPRRGDVIGANGAVLAFGIAIYPLLGGALATLDPRAPFAMYLVALPVGLAALRIAEPADRGPPAKGWAAIRGVLDALPVGSALAYYAAATLVYVLLYGGVLTTLPFLLDLEMSLSAGSIGLVLAVQAPTTGAAALAHGWLATRWPQPMLVLAGLVSLSTGLIGLSAAGSLGLVAVALAVFGLGLGLAIPALDEGISRLAPGQHRGASMSLHTSMVRAGQTVGPLVFVGLAVTLSHRSALLLGGLAGLALVFVGSLVVLARTGEGAGTSV